MDKTYESYSHEVLGIVGKWIVPFFVLYIVSLAISWYVPSWRTAINWDMYHIGMLALGVIAVLLLWLDIKYRKASWKEAVRMGVSRALHSLRYNWLACSLMAAVVAVTAVFNLHPTQFWLLIFGVYSIAIKKAGLPAGYAAVIMLGTSGLLVVLGNWEGAEAAGVLVYELLIIGVLAEGINILSKQQKST